MDNKYKNIKHRVEKGNTHDDLTNQNSFPLAELKRRGWNKTILNQLIGPPKIKLSKSGSILSYRWMKDEVLKQEDTETFKLAKQKREIAIARYERDRDEAVEANKAKIHDYYVSAAAAYLLDMEQIDIGFCIDKALSMGISTFKDLIKAVYEIGMINSRLVDYPPEADNGFHHSRDWPAATYVIDRLYEVVANERPEWAFKLGIALCERSYDYGRHRVDYFDRYISIARKQIEDARASKKEATA